MCGLDVLLLGLTMLALVIMLGEIIPSLCFSRNCFFMTVLKKTYQIFHWKTYKCDKSFLEKKNNGMINHSKCMHVHAQSCLTLCNPLCNYTPPETSVHGVFQTRNTGVDGHFLFQRIFPNQESNSRILHLLHWQEDSLSLHHLGSPSL